MNTSSFLDTLLIWSAQICVLVALGALAALTLTHARARLIFWQGLLLIVLLLPVVEPWTQLPPEALPQMTQDDGAQAGVGQTFAVSERHYWRRENWLIVIACGAGFR